MKGTMYLSLLVIGLVLCLQGSHASKNNQEERIRILEGRVDKLLRDHTGMLMDFRDAQVDASFIKRDVTSRVEALESKQTSMQSDMRPIAFNAVLRDLTRQLRLNQNILFDRVVVNQGGGYQNSTGTFVVPRGGAGLYFMSFYFQVAYDKYAYFRMNRNGGAICEAAGDANNNGDLDSQMAMCSAVVNLTEGDSVSVQCIFGKCNEAIFIDMKLLPSYFPYGFNGFRISATN